MMVTYLSLELSDLSIMGVWYWVWYVCKRVCVCDV